MESTLNRNDPCGCSSPLNGERFTRDSLRLHKVAPESDHSPEGAGRGGSTSDLGRPHRSGGKPHHSLTGPPEIEKEDAVGTDFGLPLVADYILKQGEHLEDPFYLDHPREGGRQKGDGHARYDDDEEEMSVTHASFIPVFLFCHYVSLVGARSAISSWEQAQPKATYPPLAGFWSRRSVKTATHFVLEEADSKRN